MFVMSQRTFTVGIPEELLSWVEMVSKSRGVSRNRFVREALEAALVDPDAGLHQAPSGGTAAAPPRASTESPLREMTQASVDRATRQYVKKASAVPIPKGKG